jgi:hypothetical protein
MQVLKGWRFPSNNYGPENGLDTSDLEMFKKDPDAALSREICQNSIDAKVDKTQPVKVEFKLFEINRNNIPGIDQISKQIEKCYEYKKTSEKEGSALKKMTEAINSNTITCLRISDFNTTGLIGVSTNKKNEAFYNLTKGSGTSTKIGTYGGSKGIGKFASFVASTTNTIFYYTRTIQNEIGYIGISKLRSVPFSKDDPDLMTSGTGYYSKNDKNEPILEALSLDPNFQRKSNEYGTDVFLIGFNDHSNWKNEIIIKVLDSFMVAIIKNELEVSVDNAIINTNTIEKIISNLNIRRKTDKKNIISQYELLSEGDNVYKNEFTIANENKITVYVKKYSQKEDHKATKRCVMVRYPHMKIKSISQNNYFPYSALCIIHNNELNKKLRDIENPQHTDWEIKRLNGYKYEKREVSKLIKEMEQKIKSFIRETLLQVNGERIDFEGAGEYLPFQDSGEIGNSVSESNKEILYPNSLKRYKATNPRTKKTNRKGLSLNYETGSDEDGEQEGTEVKPRRHISSTNSPNPTEETSSKPVSDVGENRILKKKELTGMNYRTIVVDKNRGRFDIVFTSAHTQDNCSLEIKMLGESTDKYNVEIISAEIDGMECNIDDGKICNFAINKGQKYKINCRLKSNKLFASEVILYAHR